MQTCYSALSSSREFDLLTCKYDVIIGRCAVCNIREKIFLLIFITLSLLISLVDCTSLHVLNPFLLHVAFIVLYNVPPKRKGLTSCNLART